MRVTKGCPVCNSDVIGTLETGYYCKYCNVIFHKRYVVFKHTREEVKRKIQEHFGPRGKRVLVEREAARETPDALFVDEKKEVWVSPAELRDATAKPRLGQRPSKKSVVKKSAVKRIVAKPVAKPTIARKPVATTKRTMAKKKIATGNSATTPSKKAAEKRPTKSARRVPNTARRRPLDEII